MNIRKIINEEIQSLLEGQTFRVYTQQRNDDFVNRGKPIYFSDNPNYWSSNQTNRYVADITGNNIVNLVELQKELGRPFDDDLRNYQIHEDFIAAIKHGYNNHLLDTIIQDALNKGGGKLADNVEARLKNADLIIGPESTWGDAPTTYVVMNPQNIKLISKTPTNVFIRKHEGTTYF